MNGRKMSDSTFNLTFAPPELASIYADSKKSALAAGASDSDAESVALRTIQHAGWFRTSDGWRRLGADVRDKVNVRRAEPQPDGRYLIRDVDVFYPNSVKGAEESYSPDDVRSIINNTNRMIESGGQPPAITKQHPHPMQKALGTVLPMFGETLNWRESKKGNGWAKCDLLADKDLVSDWRKGQITGLSAGIYDDAAKLNRRFGHVAALGAETQALSQLPRTEIFAADNQVCFSAEPAKEMTMPSKFAAMKDCYSAFAAAYAAMDSGEPGADEKMKEAKGMWAAGKASFGADWDGDEDTGSMTDMAEEPATAGEVGAAEDMPQTYAAGGETATKAPEECHEAPGSVGHFSAEMVKSLKTKVEAQNRALQILVMQSRKDNYDKEITARIAGGAAFTAESAGKMFDATKGDPNMIKEVLAFVDSLPKRPSPASVGTLFGAEGSHRVAPGANSDSVNAAAFDILRTYLPNRTFDPKAVAMANLSSRLGG